MDVLVKKALNCVDLKALSDILIDDIIEVAITRAVAKTETKIDDSIVAMLYPLIEKEAKEYVAEKIAELKEI